MSHNPHADSKMCLTAWNLRKDIPSSEANQPHIHKMAHKPKNILMTNCLTWVGNNPA